MLDFLSSLYLPSVAVGPESQTPTPTCLEMQTLLISTLIPSTPEEWLAAQNSETGETLVGRLVGCWLGNAG